MNVLLSQYNFHEDFIHMALKPYITEMTKVVVLPFSFNNNKIKSEIDWINVYGRHGKYYQTIVTPFKSYGGIEDNISWINYYIDSYEEMVDKILISDILFLPGGLPDKMLERIEEKGLTSIIKNYNKIIVGVSAGALIQLNDYFLIPDSDYEHFQYHKGLGLLNDFYIHVHYHESDDTYLEEAFKKRKAIYALKDNGGIIIDNNDISLYGDVLVKKLML